MPDPDVERLFPGLEVHLDPAPADWIVLSLLRWGVEEGTRVGALLPPHYDGYVRILHPAGGHRWAQIAAATGRTMHPAVQFTKLIPGPRPAFYNPDFAAPSQANLEPALRARLSSALAAHTATPGSCWFCLWNGFGFPAEVATRYGVVRAQARQYILLSGPLGAVERFGGVHLQGPQIWWPEDRAWCVATEIDFDSTLVAGSGRLMEQLLRDPELETLRVDRETRLDYLGDELNSGRLSNEELERLRQQL